MQLENIDAIERRLWSSADNLRANSPYASNEYFMPIMGLIFLRHAYSRFLRVKEEVEASLPSRGGVTRPLTKEDFSGRGAIYLREKAQFAYLAALPDKEDRAQAVITAMELIEADYTSLKGQLPKTEYQKLDNDVMAHLLNTFNDSALERADGDVFGRIYEYFLTRFAGLKAHDDGEFFTPVSLVQTIVNVIEPDHGKVLDPACGSGGMFVQSAHFIENMKEDPTKRVTFYGLEKNPTTIRLGKMNLAVHGLEGDIKDAISYYSDPHDLVGKVDFVMANPPFNVDEVDKEKVKNDPRLPFGLPGVNKKNKVSNANYLWISYFYSYLNDTGRAGFVMSSQASSAGRDEAKVRKKLIETGHVDVMMAIRGGFFYTRTVPCELWFLDKAKPTERQDTVLMIDARHVHRKVTRTVYDFSPEQLANLTSIVWLYRGQTERFVDLVGDHINKGVFAAADCFTNESLPELVKSVHALHRHLRPFLDTIGENTEHDDGIGAYLEAMGTLDDDVKGLEVTKDDALRFWNQADTTWTDIVDFLINEALPLADATRALVRQADLHYRLVARLVTTFENELNVTDHDAYNRRDVRRALKNLDEARKDAVAQLKQIRYFVRHAQWLHERFPGATLCDVPGLVKVVDRGTLETNDWSLTPGRYVGVAPPEVDEDFDFEEALREIHVELRDLNAEASELAAVIAKNFEELGI